MADPRSFALSVSQMFTTRAAQSPTQASLTSELSTAHVALQDALAADPQDPDAVCKAGVQVAVVGLLLAWGDR